MYSWNAKENILVFVDGHGVTRVQFGKGEPKVKTTNKAQASSQTVISMDKDGTRVLVYEDYWDRSMRLSLPGLALDHAYKRFDLRNGWLCPDGTAVIHAEKHTLHARTFLDRRVLTELPRTASPTHFLENPDTHAPLTVPHPFVLWPQGHFAWLNGFSLHYGSIDESATTAQFQGMAHVSGDPRASAKIWADATGPTVTWHTPGPLGTEVGTIGWMRFDTTGQLLSQHSAPGQSIPVVYKNRIAWILSNEALVQDHHTLTRYPLPSYGDLILGPTQVLFVPAMGEEIHDLTQNKTLSRALPAATLELRTPLADIARRLGAACQEAGIYAGIAQLKDKDKNFNVDWHIRGPYTGLLSVIAYLCIYRTLALEQRLQIGPYQSAGFGTLGGVFNPNPSNPITLDEAYQVLEWTIRHQLLPATIAHPLIEKNYPVEPGAKALLQRAIVASALESRPITPAELEAFAQDPTLPTDAQERIKARYGHHQWELSSIFTFCFSS